MKGVPGDLSAPDVTVVIPTYNYAGVLAYSIASVLDQTLRNFELFVVGDGCADDSERVVTATEDPRVEWVILPEHTGHQTGRNNEGLRRAQGAVVAFLGHDDLWLPNHLEVVMGAFDCGFVAGRPRRVPRVTCLKIAAGERRNVYRTRPTHEQAYWLAEIRAADDPERAIGAHVGRPYHLAGDRVAPITLHARALRSARYRIRKQLGLSTRASAKAEIRRLQRFKGLR